MPTHEYIAALLADLDGDLADFGEAVRGREISSVFFGGGTPSLFAPDAIAAIVEGAAARIPFARDCEVTLETNPGTVEHGRFDGYRRAGVNRISFGVQSFDDEKLRALGRIHSAAEAESAVKKAQDAGYANINLDLMYALPRQTLEGAVSDIEHALALVPAHISHYELTLEPGTPFAKRPPPLPDHDTAWDMQEACQTRLATAGFAQYEVSAYAQAGRRCRHNLNYWRFGDYLGIGAGAHGKITGTGSREQGAGTGDWGPGTGDRGSRTGNWGPGTGDWGPGTGDRRLRAGDREPETGDRGLGTEDRGSRTGNWGPGAEGRGSGTEDWGSRTGNWGPRTGDRGPGTGGQGSWRDREPDTRVATTDAPQPHSFVVRRRWKTRSPRAYLARVGTPQRIGGDEIIAPVALPFEFVLNALRLNEGVAADTFVGRTGLAVGAIDEPWREARARGWLIDDAGRLKATPLGRRFLNDVIELFLPTVATRSEHA